MKPGTPYWMSDRILVEHFLFVALCLGSNNLLKQFQKACEIPSDGAKCNTFLCITKLKFYMEMKKSYTLWLNTLWKGENAICFETQHCQWVSKAVSRCTGSWSHKIGQRSTAFISGALAKLWQATISFVMSVRTSVCRSAWNELTHIGQNFMKFDVWVFSKNLSWRVKFH
jgi:hypothetical protein